MRVNRGSSPLARGTLRVHGVNEGEPRLIPARAGNTGCTQRRIGRFSAHPRSRGEHKEHDIKEHAHRGSSPLARGTRRACGSDRLRGRLIPARAGNTGTRRVLDLRSAAHPRSRGEHVNSLSLGHTHSGSSPLARGTRQFLQWWGCWGRLIPARAGNTS